jgi:hypothetical protein
MNQWNVKSSGSKISLGFATDFFKLSRSPEEGANCSAKVPLAS